MSTNGRDGDLRRQLERWESTTLKKALDRGGERRAHFETSSTPTERLYTALDVAEQDFDRDIGEPGEYPYTRGVQPNMYRGRLWTMRQYAGFGTARESNERFKFLLTQGQTGLSVAFDLPTQIGMDSDDPNAEAEIGQVGVAIDSLADMEEMFDGIPLDRVSTSMTINAPAAVLVAMYMVVAEKQGVSSGDVMGTAQNDVLKEYVARGTYIYPPRASLRLAADLITYCARNAPKFNSISVSGYHIRDAGATAAQEIGFAFSNAIAYLEACQRAGVDIDEVAPRISWIFNTHNNFFEEVAKYRALRRMWARLLRERFEAKDPNSWKLRTHVQTGGATLTAQQPENNIVRAAVQGLTSVLGGVQSMALSCYDEALAIPTEDAQRIALRTQQIIAHESGVTDTVDPFGGSYYVETLTDQIEMQTEIQEAAVRQQQEIESGERVVVGVNRFRSQEEPEPVIFRVNTEAAGAQIERLRRVRSERDGDAAAASLRRLGEVARGTDNLMPAILDAVRSYATLGEICGELRLVWGEYRAPTVV
jgi:methylmalonyl-CoA mutase N-terminal domain/subunit